MSRFADYIEQFKIDLDLTNGDIAKIMGVGPATFDNYLCGYVKPSQQAMGKLINILALKNTGGDQSLVPTQDELPFETISFDSIIHLIGRQHLSFPVADDRLATHRVYAGDTALIRKCGPSIEDGIFLVSVDEAEPRLMELSRNDDTVRLYDDSSESALSPAEFETKVKIIGRLAYVKRGL